MTLTAMPSPPPAVHAPTTPTAGPDVSGMLMAHLVFRREFSRIAATITAPGSAGRAEAIEEHVAFICRVLHHHHTVEDAMMWPYLLERIPELQPVLERLEAEHGKMDPMIAAVTDRTIPLAQRRYILEELAELINGHLDFEEAHALPAIVATYTRADFLEVEKSVMKSARKDVPTLIGVASDHISADDFDRLVADAPKILSLLWKLSWRRKWAARRVRVFGAPVAEGACAV